MFSAIDDGLEESSRFYNQWIEEVKATVPKERLLIFNVKQGWKPLCDFLEVPVPANKPYPHVNDTQQFKVNNSVEIITREIRIHVNVYNLYSLHTYTFV